MSRPAGLSVETTSIASTSTVRRTRCSTTCDSPGVPSVRSPQDLPPDTAPLTAVQVMAPRLIELCFQTAGILEVARRRRWVCPPRCDPFRCSDGRRRRRGGRCSRWCTRTAIPASTRPVSSMSRGMSTWRCRATGRSRCPAADLDRRARHPAGAGVGRDRSGSRSGAGGRAFARSRAMPRSIASTR